MSKKRESKYKPGVGYVSGNRENLAEDSKKVLEDIKDIYKSSKIKKNIESGKIGNIKIGKYISKKKYSSIELTPVKMGILAAMFLVLLFSGVGLFGVVIIFVLLLALSICK